METEAIGRKVEEATQEAQGRYRPVVPQKGNLEKGEEIHKFKCGL